MNYKLLKKFGKKGEGPGEFYIDQNATDIKERGLAWNTRNTVFAEYFPAIRDFFVTDNKIYVITYKREKNKNENEIV